MLQERPALALYSPTIGKGSNFSPVRTWTFPSTRTARCVLHHVLVPACAPAAIVGLYFTPVAVLGCVNRGLLALAVALVSTLASVVATALGMRTRILDSRSSAWWLISALILVLPLLLLVGPLG